MANYDATVRTNYFRVTNEKKWKELFNGLCCQDEIQDFTEKIDGITYHGFGAYGSIDYFDKETVEHNFDKFLNELQKILPDDEAFIYFESGYEKLRYVTGFSIVVTKKEIVSENINDWAIKKAKELLGSDYEAKIYC